MRDELKHSLMAQLDRAKDSDDIWSLLVSAGVLGLPFKEEYGGSGLDPVLGFTVLEVLGPRAIASPYLESILLAGTLLQRSEGNAAAFWLPQLALGKAKLALAWLDGKQAAQAVKNGDDWILSGSKNIVIGGHDADAIIITVTTQKNGPNEEVTAFLLPREAIPLTSYPTIDGRHAADLHLDGITVPDSARLAISGDDIAETLDLGAAAVASESAAIMAQLVSSTRDYCVQRKQFDQSLSQFQVVQHRLADMLIQARRADAAAKLAAEALSLPPSARAKTISAAKVTIADAGRFVGQNAVQLHGGMGMTEALPISALFKRLTIIEGEFGTRDEHLARYMGL